MLLLCQVLLGMIAFSPATSVGEEAPARSRRLRRPQLGSIQPTILLSLSAEPPPAEQPVQINPDATYPGEPSIGSDGTEGNGAYYSGNMLPTSPSTPFQHQKYWQKSPYWNYFTNIWGNAPMADANFELWMRGFFKDFSLPRSPQEGQSTKGLPAWLHYYSSKYDPLVDPPFLNDYALFATAEGAEAQEIARPAGAEDIVKVYSGDAEEEEAGKEGSLKGDCSEWGLTQIIDRPCTVRTAQRNQVQVFKQGTPPYHGGLNTQIWSGMRNMAGKMASQGQSDDSPMNDEYFKIDNWWTKGYKSKEATIKLNNMPPPPPPAPCGGNLQPACDTST